jgi:uncharacterized protein
MITHVIRLQPGDDLVVEIKNLLAQKSIKAGYLATGLGSLSKLRVRFAAQSQYFESAEKFEIVSLSGSLSTNGCHIHGSFSDSQGNVVGGHVTDGCIVRTTAEIIVAELADWEFQRVQDAKTGYLELNAEKIGDFRGHHS